jgi:hypothetical protein
MALCLLLVLSNLALVAGATIWGGGWLWALLIRYGVGLFLISIWVSQYGSNRLLHWVWLYEPLMTLLYLGVYVGWLVAPRWKWAGVTYGRHGPVSVPDTTDESASLSP